MRVVQDFILNHAPQNLWNSRPVRNFNAQLNGQKRPKMLIVGSTCSEVYYEQPGVQEQ
jgi:hypothetical protein